MNCFIVRQFEVTYLVYWSVGKFRCRQRQLGSLSLIQGMVARCLGGLAILSRHPTPLCEQGEPFSYTEIVWMTETVQYRCQRAFTITIATGSSLSSHWDIVLDPGMRPPKCKSSLEPLHSQVSRAWASVATLKLVGSLKSTVSLLTKD